MTDKRCPKCLIVKEIAEFPKDGLRKSGIYPYCKECTSNKEKKWRKDYPDKNRIKVKKYAIRNPEKIHAHKEVRKALLNGSITKKPCEFCGRKESEAHHQDYTRPLDVIWLCMKHHRDIHKFNNILATYHTEAVIKARIEELEKINHIFNLRDMAEFKKYWHGRIATLTRELEGLDKKGGGKTLEKLCSRCKKNKAEKNHGCPYQEEINDNGDTEYCDCCDDCRHECLMDI